MKKKKISLMLIMAMIFSSLSTLSAQSAPITPTLKIGDYIQMGKYNNKPILWRCVDMDENGPLILTDQAITEKVFDAAGEHKYLDGTKQADNQYDDRTYYGSNVWETSSLRSWLNSTAPKGKVVWLDGCPPDDDHVETDVSYADEKGFLAAGNFTAEDLSVIKSVSQKTILHLVDVPKLKSGGTETQDLGYVSVPTALYNYDTAFYQTVTDKVFVLNMIQLNNVKKNRKVLGELYYLGKNDKEWTEPVPQINWLRDSTGYNEITYVRTIDPFNEMVSTNKANSSWVFVRPAFYMKLETAVFLSGSGTAASPYMVTGNAPAITPSAPLATKPAAPAKFNVACKGTTITLTWDKVDKADFYNVYYKKANGAYAKIKVTANSKVFKGLSKATKYTYKVTAVNSTGESTATAKKWEVTNK